MKDKTVLEILNELETQNVAPRATVYSDHDGNVFCVIINITANATVKFIAQPSWSNGVETFSNLIDALAYLKRPA